MNIKDLKSLNQFTKEDIECMLFRLSGEHYDTLKRIFEKTCYEHHDMFNESFWYNEEEPLLTYILPIIRRVYSGLFLDEKTKIKLISGNNFNKLELLKLKFDYLDLLKYLQEEIPKSMRVIDHYKYIDSTAEMCDIISRNYINMLIVEVRDTNDVKSEIRNIKIEKII